MKIFKEGETLGNEELGSPKVTFGQPNSLTLLYKCKGLRGKKGFFPVRHRNDIVRRTISLCNKEVSFACRRKIGGLFKCYAVDG